MSLRTSKNPLKPETRNLVSQVGGGKSIPLVLGTATLWLAAAGGGVLAGATQAVALALSCTWLWAEWRRPSGARLAPVAWVGIAILGFLVLTAIPVPVGWTVWHGALRHGQNLAAVERFEQAAKLGLVTAPLHRFAISRNVGGTLRIVVLGIACLTAAMLAARMDRRTQRCYLRFLAVFGALVAVAGYLGQYRWPQGNTLWWRITVPPMLPGPVACFANRNHFAGFLAVLSLPALVMARYDLAARRYWCAVALLAASAVMVTVLVLTPSRGAWVSWIGGIIFVFVADLALLLKRRQTGVGHRPVLKRFVIVVALPLLAGFFLVVGFRIASPAVRERLAELLGRPLNSPSLLARREAWHETVRVWRHYPWVGAGANALRMVYPQHRLSTHREGRTHAENQYLQLLAETGVTGTMLAVLLVLALMCAAMGWRNDVKLPLQAAGGDGLGMALGGALVVSAVHALADFPHHVPLYGMVMGSLVGIGMPWAKPMEQTADALPGRARFGIMNNLSLSMPAFICLVIVAFTVPAWRTMHRRDDPLAIARATTTELMHILSWSPTSWQAWCEFGLRGCAVGRWEPYRWGETTVSMAAKLDPNNYPLWLTLGKLRLGMGDTTGAREAFKRVRELRHWVRIPEV